MTALPTALSTGSKSLRPRENSCVRVALDVPLARLFDYALPEGMQVAPGDRVIVPFGARQRLGVVIEIDAASALAANRLKTLVAVRDDAPRLPKEWLDLMRFLAGYYQRPLGETVIASLPPRLRSTRPLPKKSLMTQAASPAMRFVPNHVLNDNQRQAVERIAAALGGFTAFLLH